MNETNIIKILVTLISLSIITLHIIYPELNIDIISLAFFIVAISPWLTPLIKSVELPGGAKVEFKDLQRIENEAKKVGLIKDKPTDKNNIQYNFLELIDINPQLALAGLRIELEKTLKKLANANEIKLGQYGMSYLIYELYNKNIITKAEHTVITDLSVTLNRAVHGEDLDERVAQWTLIVGTQILDSINKKSEK